MGKYYIYNLPHTPTREKGIKSYDGAKNSQLKIQIRAKYFRRSLLPNKLNIQLHTLIKPFTWTIMPWKVFP